MRKLLNVLRRADDLLDDAGLEALECEGFEYPAARPLPVRFSEPCTVRV